MCLLRQIARSIVPNKWRPTLKAVIYWGRSVNCPCCGGLFRTFLPMFGRPNAMCPVCGAMERHRLIWLYLKNRTKLFSSSNISLLHIAPEETLSNRLSSLNNTFYVSADLGSPRAMIKGDITNIPIHDNTFDAALCLHVLEHIEDDRRAMRELLRVLKVGSWAVLQHPVHQEREHTFEDHSVTEPEERKRVFGAAEHVRIYGRDFKDRLEAAGFLVRVEDYVSQFDAYNIERYGLKKDEVIYMCRKR